jgi:hypothetical protein
MHHSAHWWFSEFFMVIDLSINFFNFYAISLLPSLIGQFSSVTTSHWMRGETNRKDLQVTRGFMKALFCV